MKNIVILGSTGSIGKSTLALVANNPGRFNVIGLTACGSDKEMLRQIERFSPRVVAMADPQAARRLSEKTNVSVLVGPDGVADVATLSGADIVISAIVGAAGLIPTMAAIGKGRTIGLANKETLVVAGDIVTEAARTHGARLIPVDSEHSAVLQCLDGRDPQSIRRIVLTASGGPFFGRSAGDLLSITPEDALRHPSWSMGRKITIDSATLMNKGLEVIEAHHLFGLPPERIGVVIHRQSIVHSMVEYIDGSVIAQLSVPDMKGAIAYAMTYPDRLEGAIKPLDLASAGTLTFDTPDMETFPCLAYAYDALREGGSMPAVLNAANEAAVEGFLDGRIGFADIPDIIRKTMRAHKRIEPAEIESVVAVHDWAYGHASSLMVKRHAGGRA